MLFEEVPDDFEQAFHIAGCFLEAGGKVVLLRRQDGKVEGDKWGMPAGKVEEGESPEEAAARELEEETGVEVPVSSLEHFRHLYVRYPGRFDFALDIFHVGLDKEPEITIRPEEHKDFRWVGPEDALELPLMKDLDDCLRLFYGGVSG